MDNATVCISAGLCLEAPVVRPHTCTRKLRLQLMAIMGSHVDMVPIVTQINDLLCRAFVNYGTLATRKPHGMCTNSCKRRDSCHGDEVSGQLQTPHAQTHSHQVTCLQAATRLALPLQQLKSTKLRSTMTSSQVLTLCRWLSRRRASEEGKVLTSSRILVVESQQQYMRHVLAVFLHQHISMAVLHGN